MCATRSTTRAAICVNDHQQPAIGQRNHARVLFALDNLHIFDGKRVCKGRSGMIKSDAMLAQIVRRFCIIPFKFIV